MLHHLYPHQDQSTGPPLTVPPLPLTSFTNALPLPCPYSLLSLILTRTAFLLLWIPSHFLNPLFALSIPSNSFMLGSLLRRVPRPLLSVNILGRNLPVVGKQVQRLEHKLADPAPRFFPLLSGVLYLLCQGKEYIVSCVSDVLTFDWPPFAQTLACRHCGFCHYLDVLTA